MFEETGLADVALLHVADIDIADDPCSAGAEGHRGTPSNRRSVVRRICDFPTKAVRLSG